MTMMTDNREHARHSRKSGNPLDTQLRSAPALVGLTLAVLIISLAGLTLEAHAQPQSNDGAWVIWPSGMISIPTGRFGEKDEDASAPKDGNKTGFGGGLDAGYFISDFACIGVNYSMSRFDLDVAETPGFDHTGNTTVWAAEAWGRFFLRGGYQHWQPYVFFGAGIGQPKGKMEFDPPAFFGAPVNSEVNELESTVDMTSTVSAGIGVLIPATKTIAVSFEPRYTSVNTKGTARTDLFTQTDGQTFEVKSDDEGNRLKAKSNTNWWEIRLGLAFIIR